MIESGNYTIINNKPYRLVEQEGKFVKYPVSIKVTDIMQKIGEEVEVTVGAKSSPVTNIKELAPVTERELIARGFINTPLQEEDNKQEDNKNKK